jgi:hypothetical protein
MKLIDWIVKVAKIIVKGREAGMWSETNKPGSNLNKPHKPEDTRGITG